MHRIALRRRNAPSCRLAAVAVTGALAALTSAVVLGAPAELTAQTAEVRYFHSPGAPVIYAGTRGGGVWRSGNSGASWSPVATLPERYIGSISGSTSDPNLLFVATTGGVYRSLDGGTSWSRATHEGAVAVLVDPANDQNVLVGVPGAGVYRSTDRGATFRWSGTGLDSTDVTALAADPSPSTFFVALNSNATGGWGGVFRSTDGGTTWTSWNGSGAGALPNRFVTSLAVTASGAVIAGTYDSQTGGRPYRRAGTGAWTAGLAANTSGVLALHADRTSATKVWMGTRAQGLYRSTDDGASFVPLSGQGQPVFTDIFAVGSLPGAANRALAGVNGLGVFATIDNGATWTKSANSLAADRATELTGGASASELFLGTLGGGVHRSVDGGTTFAAVNGGLVNTVYGPAALEVASLSGTGATVYGATSGFGGLHRFNGSSWDRVSEAGLPNAESGYWNPTSVAVDPNNAQNAFYALFDGTAAGTWRRHGGPSWTLVRTGPHGSAGALRIVPGAAGSQRWYILNGSALPDRSLDNGLTWTSVAIASASQFGFMPFTFFALAENPFATGDVLASTNKGLFGSSDNGATWSTVVSTGLASTVLTGIAYSALVNNRVFAGDRAGHFHCSNDGGATWTLRETARSAIVGLSWRNNLVFLHTDGAGVLQRDPTCP